MCSHKIQFQPGMSIPEFLRHFGTEVLCAEALLRASGPKGFRCARYDDARHYVVSQGARMLFQYIGCRHQASVTAGTMMEHSKLPLATGFLAIHLISQAMTGMSAMALKRDLDVSYPTALLLYEKVNRAMGEREAVHLLDEAVQLHDTYLSRERSVGQTSRRSRNKVPPAALPLDDSGGPAHLKLDLVSRFTALAIGKWTKACLAPGCVVISDELGCFTAATDASGILLPRVGGHLKPKDLHEFEWINTVPSNLKTTLSSKFNMLKFSRYDQTNLPAFAYGLTKRIDLDGLVNVLIANAARSGPAL